MSGGRRIGKGGSKDNSVWWHICEWELLWIAPSYCVFILMTAAILVQMNIAFKETVMLIAGMFEAVGIWAIAEYAYRRGHQEAAKPL